jgi:PAS domain S-box-containing protein
MNDTSEHRISSLLDALPDLFFAFGEDGTIELWNDAVPEVTGYSETELARMQAAEFFATADPEEVTGTIAELLETGTGTIEAELATASGERIPYEFNLHPVRADGPLAFAGIGRDVSVRERAEKERDAVLNRMRDGFFAVDAE